jgi:tRNA(Ile)-lysidine synthase
MIGNLLTDQLIGVYKQLGVRDAKLALGFSGGVDSTLMAETLRRKKIPFIALHFNHRWRGKQSDADARWVREWCQKRKIPCIIGRAKSAGATSEAIARKERWEFFQSSCKQRKVRALLLAHHADDVVETVLFQLLRGSGMDGLEGIKYERLQGNLKIIRPWLYIFKDLIVAQALAWKLDWCDDITNNKTDYTRNRLRHDVIPYLSQSIGRDVRPAILRLAQIVAEENAYWEAMLPSIWPERASISWLKNQAIALQRRWLRGWLRYHNVGDISFENIESILRLITQTKPAKINLARGWFCRRTAGELWIQK